MNRLGLTHLSVRVDDLESLRRDVEKFGGQVLESTDVYNPDFEAGAIMITDPDGTRIELVQTQGDPSKPPGS